MSFTKLSCIHYNTKRFPRTTLLQFRARSKELIELGDAIVKLGVPRKTKAEQVEKFKKELKKFSQALIKFGADAESGTDAELKTSYSAVHESFEELAGMLPVKDKHGHE